jgi:hypothetical protein
MVVIVRQKGREIRALDPLLIFPFLVQVHLQ